MTLHNKNERWIRKEKCKNFKKDVFMICVNIHIKAQIFIIKNKYLLFYINKFVVKSFSSTNNKDGEIFLTK